MTKKKVKWLVSFTQTALQTHHVDCTLKRRGNSRSHVVSTWNPRGVFVGNGANTLTHDKVIKRSFNNNNLALATIKSKYNSKDILLT